MKELFFNNERYLKDANYLYVLQFRHHSYIPQKCDLTHSFFFPFCEEIWVLLGLCYYYKYYFIMFHFIFSNEDIFIWQCNRQVIFLNKKKTALTRRFCFPSLYLLVFMISFFIIIFEKRKKKHFYNVLCSSKQKETLHTKVQKTW